MGTVYRDIDTRRNRSDEQRKWRADALAKLIGTDSAGPISVDGVPLNLVDRYPGLVKSTVPSILEGFSLCKGMPTLEAAATALAAGDHSGCWDALKWLCLFNEADPEETAKELRGLSDRVRRRDPENGIHPHLPKRVAALLLWLTGYEQDDRVAARLIQTSVAPSTTSEIICQIHAEACFRWNEDTLMSFFRIVDWRSNQGSRE